ncbi:hypothetical protein RXS22_29600, partial [Pseudomonas aeruginosa]|nr:hypothetical protein [Pseudomonas aeruginosa]
PGYDHELDNGKLLNALAHAALLDVEAAAQAEMRRMRRQEDLPAAHKAILAELTERASNAERSLAEARQTIEVMRSAHVNERSKRRHYQALVEGSAVPLPQNGTVTEPEPEEPVEDPSDELPKGVRKRN